MEEGQAGMISSRDLLNASSLLKGEKDCYLWDELSRPGAQCFPMLSTADAA